jgi:hypothetical protein
MKRVAVALLLAACASAPPAPDGKPAAAAPQGFLAPAGVRIVKAAYGKSNSKASNGLLVPFGVNQNGTELMFVLLDWAAHKGAAYLGDVQVIVTFKWGGTPIECRSPLVFDDEVGRAAAPAPAAAAEASPYATEVERFEPHRVGVTATEQELVCREGSQLVVQSRQLPSTDLTAAENPRRMERAHRPDGLGPSNAAQRDVERTVTAERADRCSREQVTRHAERYDYEVKLGFVPPNLEYLSSRYADGKLVQGQPKCYRIAEADVGKLPEYRLTATAYYRGAVKQQLPVALPSTDSIEILDRRIGAKAPGFDHQQCKLLGRKDCDTVGSGTEPSNNGWWREH